MVISVWCGEGKPTDLNEYLGPFVNELNVILNNGVRINGKHITVFCRCFICDSPARAFIKGINVLKEIVLVKNFSIYVIISYSC